MKDNKTYVKWGLTAFLVILGGFASYYVIFHLSSLSLTIKNFFVILMPIIDGFILAYLLAPIVNATERTITTPIFEFLKKGENGCTCFMGSRKFFLNRNSTDCKQHSHYSGAISQLH